MQLRTPGSLYKKGREMDEWEEALQLYYAGDIDGFMGAVDQLGEEDYLDKGEIFDHIADLTFIELSEKLERARNRKRLIKVETDKEAQRRLIMEQLAKDLHRQEKSYSEIAKELHRRRYRAPRGGMFSRTQIGRLVKR